MTHKIDFHSASSEQIISALGEQLNAIRLSQNISQSQLAADAGVSRSTLTRLADGQAISLDSFIRVMLALKLTDQLAALLPDPSVQPVERIRLDNSERKRASNKTTKNKKSNTTPWTWNDEGSSE